MKKVMMGTEAAALAAKLARVQVISAYPITPQTVIVEELSDMVGKGELDAQFLPVESEHSAMASCIGASATGARAFTATSSQGLALMHEVLHYAAGGGYPVVMVNANRALTPPWNLYCDHTDSLSQRDTGWLQYYCFDVQDVLDSILMGYRVAEEISLPLMINMDAFYLTHTSEVVDIPDQEEVDDFLPPYRTEYTLDVESPRTFGNVCGADLYASFKFRRHGDTLKVSSLWEKTAEEFRHRFGRFHPPVEDYRMEDAQTAIISIGTAAGACRMAVDELREKGIAAGSLRISLVRPFPSFPLPDQYPKLRQAVVIDRDVSFGAEGIIAQELKARLFRHHSHVQVEGFVAGIGGVDITRDLITKAVFQVLEGGGDAVLQGDSLWVGVLP